MLGKARTKEQQRRFVLLQDIGCIACLSNGHPCVPGDIHHTDQKSHDSTTVLCEWHHRGVPKCGTTVTQCKKILGPSLALHRKDFEEIHGRPKELLDKTNKLLEALEDILTCEKVG